MMLIARRCFFFTALQFVAITRYYVSLRLAKKKQQRTHAKHHPPEGFRMNCLTMT